MKIEIGFSKGVRKCSKCKGKIAKGAKCMHISAGFCRTAQSGNLCMPCMIKMINGPERIEEEG